MPGHSDSDQLNPDIINPVYSTVVLQRCHGAAYDASCPFWAYLINGKIKKNRKNGVDIEGVHNFSEFSFGNFTSTCELQQSIN